MPVAIASGNGQVWVRATPLRAYAFSSKLVAFCTLAFSLEIDVWVVSVRRFCLLRFPEASVKGHKAYCLTLETNRPLAAFLMSSRSLLVGWPSALGNKQTHYATEQHKDISIQVFLTKSVTIVAKRVSCTIFDFRV